LGTVAAATAIAAVEVVRVDFVLRPAAVSEHGLTKIFVDRKRRLATGNGAKRPEAAAVR